jgi:hypothetical protein
MQGFTRLYKRMQGYLKFSKKIKHPTFDIEHPIRRRQIEHYWQFDHCGGWDSRAPVALDIWRE